MKRKKANVIHIKGVIHQLFSNIEKTTETKPTKEKIEEIWRKVAGELAIKHSHPTAIKKKTLIINVDSPVWIYELQQKKDTLLYGIQKQLNNPWS